MIIEELRKLVKKSEQEIHWANKDNRKYREKIVTNIDVVQHHKKLKQELENLIKKLEEE